MKTNFYSSESFNKDDILFCFKKSFGRFLHKLEVNSQADKLSEMLDEESSIKSFTYLDDELLFFHVGEKTSTSYICTFFCWNYFNKIKSKYFLKSDYNSYKNMVRKNLVLDLKEKHPDIKHFVIPVNKSRKRKTSYHKFLKYFFKNIESVDLNFSNYPHHDFFIVDLDKEYEYSVKVFDE